MNLSTLWMNSSFRQKGSPSTTKASERSLQFLHELEQHSGGYPRNHRNSQARAVEAAPKCIPSCWHSFSHPGGGPERSPLGKCPSSQAGKWTGPFSDFTRKIGANLIHLWEDQQITECQGPVCWLALQEKEVGWECLSATLDTKNRVKCRCNYTNVMMSFPSHVPHICGQQSPGLHHLHWAQRLHPQLDSLPDDWSTVWSRVVMTDISYMRHVCIVNIAVSLLTANVWFILGSNFNKKTQDYNWCVAVTFLARFSTSVCFLDALQSPAHHLWTTGRFPEDDEVPHDGHWLCRWLWVPISHCCHHCGYHSARERLVRPWCLFGLAGMTPKPF